MLAYMRRCHDALVDDGVLFMDMFGGPESFEETKEKTKHDGFTYIWEQARFNPIDHDFQCRIHFKLKDGTKMRRAFTYDWRMWMLPELHELLLEAGFTRSEVYVEGWDDEEDDTDGIFRRRKRFENQSGWVAYVVALT